MTLSLLIILVWVLALAWLYDDAKTLRNTRHIGKGPDRISPNGWAILEAIFPLIPLVWYLLLARQRAKRAPARAVPLRVVDNGLSAIGYVGVGLGLVVMGLGLLAGGLPSIFGALIVVASALGARKVTLHDDGPPPAPGAVLHQAPKARVWRALVVAPLIVIAIGWGALKVAEMVKGDCFSFSDAAAEDEVDAELAAFDAELDAALADPVELADPEEWGDLLNTDEDDSLEPMLDRPVEVAAKAPPAAAPAAPAVRLEPAKRPAMDVVEGWVPKAARLEGITYKIDSRGEGLSRWRWFADVPGEGGENVRAVVWLTAADGTPIAYDTGREVVIDGSARIQGSVRLPSHRAVHVSGMQGEAVAYVPPDWTGGPVVAGPARPHVAPSVLRMRVRKPESVPVKSRRVGPQVAPDQLVVDSSMPQRVSASDEAVEFRWRAKIESRVSQNVIVLARLVLTTKDGARLGEVSDTVKLRGQTSGTVGGSFRLPRAKADGADAELIVAGYLATD